MTKPSEGLFYVTYPGPDGEESGGWFSWLFGGESDNPLVGKEYQTYYSADTNQEGHISMGWVMPLSLRIQQAISPCSRAILANAEAGLCRFGE